MGTDSGLLSWLSRPGWSEDDLVTTRRKLDLPAGDLPAHRFVDEGELARGHRTSIRRVFDLKLRRRLAMKVLDPRLAPSPRDVARFEEEARLTGMLDHPHVPPVYELGQDEDGTRYFTMRLVDARPLSQLASAPDYDPAEEPKVVPLLAAFVRACDAVAFAHERGVVHCALKPENVWVGPFGQVYVMDFGAAKIAPGFAPDGIDVAARAKEPAWPPLPDDAPLLAEAGGCLAPEQARQDHAAVGPATDVFALGALLYRIVARRAVWDAKTKEALVERAAKGEVEPPWLVDRRRLFPRRLGEIAMRALKADPSQRTPDVATLRAEVERWLSGERGAEVRRYAPGALIVREGDAGEEAFVITSGRCRAFKTLDDGRRVLREMSEGEEFGETAILASLPRSASVEAVDDVQVRVVGRALLEGELERSQWMGEFVRGLARRFFEVSDESMRADKRAEEFELATEILEAMLRAGGARELRWPTLRVQLCRRHRRSGPETDAILARLPMFHVDPATDVLMFVEQLEVRK